MSTSGLELVVEPAPIGWPSPCGSPRLLIDHVLFHTIDLHDSHVAKIKAFIGEIAKTVSGGKPAPFHSMRGGWNYEAGFRAYLNELLAYEKTGATAITCQTGAKRSKTENSTKYRT